MPTSPPSSRTAEARKWGNEKGRRGYFNVAAGQHVGDSIWRASIRARLGCGEGLQTVEVMHDISKAFGRIGYRKLAEQAAAVGYPARLMMMATR